MIATPPVTGCRLCGDCDGSTTVDMNDCTAVLDIANGMVAPPPARTSLFGACDLKPDGTIDMVDYNRCLASIASGNFECADCADCGDCNFDGQVDIVDALVAAQFAAGPIIPPMGSSQSRICDANGSGTVDSVDALLIAQEAAGLNPPLACP